MSISQIPKEPDSQPVHLEAALEQALLTDVLRGGEVDEAANVAATFGKVLSYSYHCTARIL